jgi:4-amino-4-deoxy-L-arabinose transferase-like glycosyltransferase
MHRRRDLLLAFALFGVALIVRLSLLANTGFDGLYGQDSYAYYSFSAHLFPTLISGVALPPFNYPLGYPALLATAFALLGESAPTAQTITLLMGAASAPLAYLLARQAGCRPLAACAAGLIFAFSGQAIQSSLVIMSDMPALFWLMSSFLFILSNHKGTRELNHRGAEEAEYTEKNDYLLKPSVFSVPSVPPCFNLPFLFSTLCLTLAVLMRWQMIAALPAWMVVLLFSRRRLRLNEMLVVALVVAPLLGAQAVYSAGNTFPTVNHPFVANWSPTHIAQHVFDTDEGHFEYVQPNGLFYAQVGYASPYLSPLLGVMVTVGIWKIFEPRRHEGTRREIETQKHGGCRVHRGVWIILWLAVPYVFLAGIPHQNIRYALIMLPPLAILCALGIDWLLFLTTKYSNLFSWRSWRFNLSSSLIPHPSFLSFSPSRSFVSFVPSWFKFFSFSAFSVSLCLIFFFLLASLLTDGHTYTRAFIERQQRDKAVVLWARDMLPPDTPIYTQGLTAALTHYSQLEPIELYGQTPQTLATLPERGYLLIHDWEIEHQWAGLSPQLAVAWLVSERGARKVGGMNDYTLYQVGVR